MFESDVSLGPLLLPAVIVWTPEIERLALKVAKWIQMDLPGGTVFGQQRNGKSRATIYLGKVLAAILGYEIGFVRWSIPDQRNGRLSERDFTQEMMHQSACDRTQGRDLAVLRRRFHSHLVEIAQACGSKRIVIVVDEAQNLCREHYGFIIHWFNMLEKAGVHPFLVLIGQPELENTTTTWAEANGMQVVGRFFARQHQYRGIERDEIALVLEAFDTPQDGEASSVLEPQFPDAYAAGHGLKGIAHCYEEALDIIMKTSNISNGLRIPMQYFRSSLLSLLLRLQQEKCAWHLISTPMVLTAIEDSGFLSVLSYYVDKDSVPKANRSKPAKSE